MSIIKNLFIFFISLYYIIFFIKNQPFTPKISKSIFDLGGGPHDPSPACELKKEA
jgi:hypothetical protein